LRKYIYMKVGIIILAAGESKRMGVPKQLLDVFGESVLKKVVNEALKTHCYPITVVVGAHKKHIVPELEGIPVTITDNPHWQSGIGGSIRMGLIGTYLVSKEIDAVIITTSDMPLVNAEVFNALIVKAEASDALLIVSDYGEAKGVPALIKRPLFEELLDLEGDEGVRQIFAKYKTSLTAVDFPGGLTDLDTKEDYYNYLHSVN
jgi:molybdenum cofactor cytidylyltransferase